MTEQEITDKIESLCGGAKKAERLNYIWRSTLGFWHREMKFKGQALREGFPQQAIELFMIQ